MKKLSKEKINKFKTFFEGKQKEILDSTSAKHEEFAEYGSLEIGDEADQAQNLLLKSIADKLNKHNQEIYHKLNFALQRINEGLFGICTECECSIPEKRLEALPYCETCVDCAEILEKESKQYRSR